MLRDISDFFLSLGITIHGKTQKNFASYTSCFERLTEHPDLVTNRDLYINQGKGIIEEEENVCFPIDSLKFSWNTVPVPFQKRNIPTDVPF
jgi:hypothetical protein